MSKTKDEGGITASALLNKKIAEQRFVVSGILPSKSVCLMASPPKSMKSFWALSTSMAVANGSKVFNKIPVEPGPVLYLDLESHEARTRSRLAMMCKDEPAPKGLHLFFEWERLDQGGLQRLENWFSTHRAARLLVIDVWGKIAPARSGSSIYESDYRSVEGIRQLVQKFNIAALLVTHTRKAASDDPLTRIAGSNGLTGAVDVILSLARTRGEYDGKLFVSGREVSEQELALRWDPSTGRWGLNDDPLQVMLSLSPERLAVAEFIRSSSTPVGPKVIAEQLGMSYAGVRQMVRRLLRARVVERVRGGYSSIISHNPPVASAPQGSLLVDCDSGDAGDAQVAPLVPHDSATTRCEAIAPVVSLADFMKRSDPSERTH